MLKNRNSLGFTLIELVIVIAIIGILAIVAIPRFINLSSQAQAAATSAIAGALSSANANNYGARKLSTSFGIAVENCQDLIASLQGGLPAGYTITSLAVALDVNANCTLNGPGGSTAIFTATGIS